MLVRRYGDFDAAEDAVQEALLAAAGTGRATGSRRTRAAGWSPIASRRLIDQHRSEQARRQREDRWPPCGSRPAAGGRPTRTTRSSLLFLCCHPSLTPASAIALTLRAVGGLTTAEIARAFLVPEATMAQRISRAKQRDQGRRAPVRDCRPPEERATRLPLVLHVLYLIFNEGYASTAGRDVAPRRPVRRGDPADPDCCTACCPTTARSPGCSR